MKTIYSLRLARYLIDRGFKCEGIAPNPRKPWFNAYLFSASEELEAIITEYSNLSKENIVSARNTDGGKSND